MSFFRVKYLSFFFILISIFSFLNIIYSYYFNLYLNLNTYYFSLIISAVIGIIFYKIKTNQKKPSIFEKILTVLLGYVLMPLILSIPFYLSIYNLSFLNSLFEAVSGFTSTGFTVFENIKHIDQGLILWRSSIQWIGGLYFLYSIIFLIDIYDESLKKSLTNFLSFNSTEILKQSIKILLLMLISFFSIFFTYNLIFLRNKNLNFFYEDIHLFLYFIVVASIFFVFFSYDANFTFSFLSLVSSISNIGISLEVDQANLHFIYILLVIIGGSFFSTSSGLRFLKIYSLTKYSINQILSFNRPKYILTGDTNTIIFYNGNAWELTQGNTLIASSSNNTFNVPTDWGIQVIGKEEELIVITSTDTGDFTIGEEVQGNVRQSY